MLNLMKGNRGRWLALEALPAYVLIFAVWPLISGFQGSIGWLSGFVQVYSSGDCAAVAFCFLITACFDLARHLKSTGTDELDQNWWVPGALALSLILSVFIYIAVKLNPAGIDEHGCIPLKAYVYCMLSWAVAIGTSVLVYHSKR